MVLAGLWMTATHLPLIVQARNGEAPWGASLYHSIPGFVVLLFGVVWSTGEWTKSESADALEQAPTDDPGADGALGRPPLSPLGSRRQACK